jgi:16S rRNA (cytosine1402-N4)-methyltransferase
MKVEQDSNKSFHLPVMANEVTDLFSGYKNPVIYDGTLGGGGHAEQLFQSLPVINKYIAVDRDREAIDFSKKRLRGHKNIFYYHGIYSEIRNAMVRAGVENVDGFFLDLGISSHQIDEDKRGFAFRSGLKLDMRMNRDDDKTAADILNSYSESDLSNIIFTYGEERFAKRIAANIVKEREKIPINTSDTLIKIIDRCVAPSHKVKSFARVFQALRIEVNRELEILSEALEQGFMCLKKGGRMVIISYHSLEDRIVKRFFRSRENPCNCPPELPFCVCGKKPDIRILKPEKRKPQTEEIFRNPRARSAKLRAGEKL